MHSSIREVKWEHRQYTNLSTLPIRCIKGVIKWFDFWWKNTLHWVITNHTWIWFQEAAPVDSSVCSICTQGQNSEVKGESDLVVCSECNKGGKSHNIYKLLNHKIKVKDKNRLNYIRSVNICACFELHVPLNIWQYVLNLKNILNIKCICMESWNLLMLNYVFLTNDDTRIVYVWHMYNYQ